MKVGSYWESTGTYYYGIIEKSEIQKLDFALCQGPKNIGGRQTLQQFYNSCQTKPDLIINGGLFNMANGETIWVYRDENKTIMDYGIDYYWGAGTVNNQLVYGKFTDYKFTDFVSGYPVLLVNGEIGEATAINPAHDGWLDSGLIGRHQRTALAWNDTTVYLLTTEGGKGKTLLEVAKFCRDFLKCKFAINLDGGGSCAMMKGSSYVVKSDRPVDNVICVYLKKEEEQPTPTPQSSQEETSKTLYRVQCGAYKNKENAEELMNKLKTYPEFSGAYVRLIDNLYKVQVGAFGVRENAVNLVNKLKDKGFSAFITTK